MASRVVKYLPLDTVDIRTTKGPEEWARIGNATLTAAGFIHYSCLDKELLPSRGKKKNRNRSLCHKQHSHILLKGC